MSERYNKIISRLESIKVSDSNIANISALKEILQEVVAELIETETELVKVRTDLNRLSKVGWL